MTSLSDLPCEILLHISSYFHDPYNLHDNIFPFRSLCKSVFSVTECETFWRQLVSNQLTCGYELHLWLHDLELRTRKQHGGYKIVENDFVTVVNDWIDQLVDNQNYSDDNNNMVIQFLVRLAIGQDNFQHFGSVRVSVCIRYLIEKLFEPMMKLFAKINTSGGNHLGDYPKEIHPNELLNMKLVEFLSNDDHMSIPLVSHWVEMDYFNSLIPRQYFIWIVKYLSNFIIKDDESGKEKENAAVWICDFLENTLGFQVTDMLFLNNQQTGCNFEREDFIPSFTSKFSLQFLGVWVGNLDLVKWCMEHRSENGNNRIDQLMRNGSLSLLDEGIPEYSVISSYGSSYKRDVLGLTILHYAIRGRHLEIVRLLIEKYKANPFIGPISPALLAFRLHSLNGEDCVYKEIYQLLVDTYKKEYLEKHLETNNLFDESSATTTTTTTTIPKIFDLDETEEDDCEKIQIDKGEVYDRPLTSHKLLDDECYYSVSDEDVEEEFMDIGCIRSESKKIPKIESNDPWVQVAENDTEFKNTLDNLLRDVEIIAPKDAVNSDDEMEMSVIVRDRVNLEEKRKKRVLEEEDGNPDLYEPKFKKRKDMIIPKEFFHRLTDSIAQDRISDFTITPSVYAIMQQEVENQCTDLFEKAQEIAKFFQSDILRKEFLLGAVNLELLVTESILKDHLSALSITTATNIAPEMISNLVTEINERNLIAVMDYDFESDPDFTIELEDDDKEEGENEGGQTNEHGDDRSTTTITTTKKKEEEGRGEGYESDWSDESEMGFEVKPYEDGVFYPCYSIDEIEQERELNSMMLADDEYDIKYEPIIESGGNERGYLVYTKDVHLVKRLLSGGLSLDDKLLHVVGNELFYV